MAYIRIESHQRVATDAKVFFVNGDEEIDISSCISAAEISLGVGEVSTVNLTAYLGGVNVRAEVREVLIHHLKPEMEAA